jgi:hypothetical protein
MSDLQEIARTVATLAVPGMKPKDLVTAVRKHHPDASKKQISRAAFMAMILASESDPDLARHVQELALASRGEAENEDGGKDAKALASVISLRKKRKDQQKAV